VAGRRVPKRPFATLPHLEYFLTRFTGSKEVRVGPFAVQCWPATFGSSRATGTMHIWTKWKASVTVAVATKLMHHLVD
jgi:hypothetical protein